MTGRILIVEDEPDNAEIAKLAIVSAGHSVKLALNGREALEALDLGHSQANPYDLALVDLLMPEMDGVELLTAIRADARYADLPVIGVTAVVQPEALQRLWDAGMNQLVVKPYRIHTLREVVQLVLEQKH